MKFTIEASEKEIERAKEWKALADEYNLTLVELRELAYHIKSIEKLTNKKK